MVTSNARDWRESGTVLVADDEEIVRLVTAAALEQHGFHVIPAADGKEAVEKFRERSGEIRAVLLDLSMPEMGGMEAFRAIRSIRDDVPVILISGYGEEESSDEDALGKPSAFLQKPYTAAALAAKVREVLEQVPSK